MMYKLSIRGLALQLAGMRQSVNEATMHKCRVLGYVFTRFESPTMTSEKKKQQKSISMRLLEKDLETYTTISKTRTDYY